MSKLFSKSTNGFYDKEFHGDEAIPDDAIDISDDEWLSLLHQQSNGKQIVPDSRGVPIAVDPDPSPALLIRRDKALHETDWLVARHRDESEEGSHTTLTSDQYRALLAWRRALREITSSPSFPNMALPKCPV